MSKDKDLLPLENAMAQVNFWKSDLIQAERFLEYIQRFKAISGYAKMNEEALKDVKESQEGLTKARFKLEEAKSLE